MNHAVTIRELVEILLGIGVLAGVIVGLLWAFAKGMSDTT